METPFEKASGNRNVAALKRELNLAKKHGKVRKVSTDREAQMIAEFQKKAKARLEQIRRSL